MASLQKWEENSKAQPIRVKNGTYESKGNDFTATFLVTDVVYGDLNGDGMDEAVVLTTCNAVGHMWWDEGFIYTMRNGKPVMLLRIEGDGDRANSGMRDARISDGLLLVERLGNRMGQAVGAEYFDTTSYRLAVKKLVRVGRPFAGASAARAKLAVFSLSAAQRPR
jgi:hypothetical protein